MQEEYLIFITLLIFFSNKIIKIFLTTNKHSKKINRNHFLKKITSTSINNKKFIYKK